MLGKPGVDGLSEAAGVLREWQHGGAKVYVEAPLGALVQDLLLEDGWNTDEPWKPLHRDLTEPVKDSDDQGNAVAAVTVWSAGPGRPGLLEPMGVHREHRGHGYGNAITDAAAAAPQELGSSSTIVCAPSSNVGAVATYKSASFQPLPEIRDRCRDA